VDLQKEDLAEKEKLAEYQKRYNDEIMIGANVQREIVESSGEATAMLVNDAEYMIRMTGEVAKKKEIAWDFKPVEKYGHIVRGVTDSISNMWSQALLNQWNEGQNFFTNMARGFEQMLAAMAAQMMAKSAIFGIASLFGGGTVVSGGLGALDFIFGGLFQHGGKFTVPGSGMKEQPVLIGARAGETVTVNTPEQTPAGETINIIFEGNVLTDTFIEDIAIPKIARAARMRRV
jgi:hypothetical protein